MQFKTDCNALHNKQKPSSSLCFMYALRSAAFIYILNAFRYDITVFVINTSGGIPFFIFVGSFLLMN